MKRFFKYILAAAAPVLAVAACVEEDIYQPGESDTEGCYGVYFPAQETALVLDPSDPTEYSIVVGRTNTIDDITVPFVFTASDERVFKIGTIEFEDGQSETEVSLDFSKAEVGKSYTCSFSITDERYASRYSSNPVNLDFSVVRERWNELGKIGFSSTYYWEIEVPQDSEHAAILYQNDVNRNMYRVENPFAKRYTNFTDGSEWLTFYVAQKGETFYKQKVDRDDLVVFERFNTGYTHSNYNEKIWMLHPGNFTGMTIDDWECNRVLQYQENGLPAAVQIAPYYYLFNAGGGWDATQENGDITIVFPGAVLTDYTFEIEAGITSDGELPLYFTLGADVATIKYAIYEGNLNSAQISNHVDAIASGKETVSEVKEDSEVKVTLEETGVYTVVAVSFDKDDEAQESDAVVFNYLSENDKEDYAVVVKAGLELTSKYEAKGYDKTNSIEFYMYGSGLTEVYYGLYKTETVENNGIDAIVEDLLSGEPADEEELAAINGGMYSDLFVNLTAQTSYTFVVYASNGYAVKTVEATITTEGLPLELVGTGTYTYDFWWEGKDTGLELYYDPNIKSAESYQISNWGGGVSFKYTQDPQTGKINVPLQPIGDSHQSYGAVYVIEAKDCYDPDKYEGYADLIDSYYDAQTDTAYFCVAYIVSAGVFGDSIETFGLDKDNASVSGSLSLAALKANSPAALCKASVISRMSRLQKAGISTEHATGAVDFKVTSQNVYRKSRTTDLTHCNDFRELAR